MTRKTAHNRARAREELESALWRSGISETVVVDRIMVLADLYAMASGGSPSDPPYAKAKDGHPPFFTPETKPSRAEDACTLHTVRSAHTCASTETDTRVSVETGVRTCATCLEALPLDQFRKTRRQPPLDRKVDCVGCEGTSRARRRVRLAVQRMRVEQSRASW